MAKVLLYNFSEDNRRKKVKAALFQCAIPSREVETEEQLHPLGYLLGMESFLPFAEKAETPFTEEMIVMHDLSSGQFHRFLDSLRAEGIRVPLKAVVTEHNVQWSSLKLYAELQAEHQAIAGDKNQPIHEQK